MPFEQLLSLPQAANDPVIVALWCLKAFDSEAIATVWDPKGVTSGVYERAHNDCIQRSFEKIPYTRRLENRRLTNVSQQQLLLRTSKATSHMHERMVLVPDIGNRKAVPQSTWTVVFFARHAQRATHLKALKNRVLDLFL